jgi:molybdopterin converting factor small subunit
MQIQVRYFAAAAEAAGTDEERMDVPDGSRVGDLRRLLEERYGDAMRAVTRSGSFLVDGTVRRDPAHPLGERVDILPPFAGG